MYMYKTSLRLIFVKKREQISTSAGSASCVVLCVQNVSILNIVYCRTGGEEVVFRKFHVKSEEQ